MHSIAIKINVSSKEQEKIRNLLESVGETHKHPKFHCTVGFIEKIPSKDEAMALGEQIVTALQDHIHPHFPLYEVEAATLLFGHVMAFTPTLQSEKELKDLNLWLFKKAEDISGGLFSLDKTTAPQNYIPHMTLWHTRHLDKRFRKLEEVIKHHPTYCLSDAAYVVFTQ